MSHKGKLNLATIRYVRGDLLGANADAFVNAVNSVGVMGKGIALAFKRAFPENFERYVEACERGEVRIGSMFVTERRAIDGPRWIINFPTKMHWRQPSKLEWIEEGLVDLRLVIAKNEIRSIAIPALGSGLGGLAWNDVRPRIEHALSSLENVDVLVYEPLS